MIHADDSGYKAGMVRDVFICLLYCRPLSTFKVVNRKSPSHLS